MSAGRGAAVAVTGASGFIGRHLCDTFRRLGWEVRALARDTSVYPFAETGVTLHRCVLPGPIDPASLQGVSVLVHAAYVTRHRDLEQSRRVNEEGTRSVLEAGRAARVGRIVFISSQSAHAGAVSYYGKSKRALEGLLDPDRDLIIRPGLVLGRSPAGLFDRMCETVRRARMIPLFDGGRQPLQTVHVRDLCDAIAAAVTRGLTGRFIVAEPEPIPMARFLRLLARRLGSRPLFVPCPSGPALALLRAIEWSRLPFPVSSENLLGLRQMRADATRDDLARLGVRARSAAESLDEIFGPERSV